MSNAVKVAVRARPLSDREIKSDSKITMSMSGATIRLHDPKGRASSGGAGPVLQGTKSFSYDYCHWSTQRGDENFASQEKVFSDIGKLLVNNAISGYNASAMAYGQTGSGKTYTMMGTQAEPGLVPRLCQALFDHINSNQDPKVSFRTEVSYMEIYNEHVGDLLAAGSKKIQHNLRVREDPRRGPYVQGLGWHVVSDQKAMLDRMNVGNSVRTTASTLMNDTSSRSHAIFTIKFTHACFSADRPQETVSRINLVDLAGSERAKSTGATGSRLKEGSQINKSLVALGNVISALAYRSQAAASGKSKKTFTPYRDSMLTWLLKDSLGGNSRTIMVATVSPSESNYSETLSTLRYASRAKDIVNKAVVNEDANVRLIRELRAEITRLKSLLAAGPNVGLSPTSGTDAAATMSQELAKSERLAEQLTQQWAGRWEETRQLSQGREVAVKGEGVSVVLNAEVPHLVAISEDLLSTGVKLYYLEDGVTTMGTQAASDGGKPFDIELYSSSDSKYSLELINTSGTVTLRLVEGSCYLNGLPMVGEAELHQGQILLVGENNLFRFQHPQEAAQMRRDLRDRGIQPTSGFSTPASVIYAPMLEAQRRQSIGAVHSHDTSPEHAARPFTPDAVEQKPAFNPVEVAAKLAAVKQYDSDDSATSFTLLTPAHDSSRSHDSSSSSHSSPSESMPPKQSQNATPKSATLTPLFEESCSESTSPLKSRPGQPRDGRSAGGGHDRITGNLAATDGTGDGAGDAASVDAAAVAQKLESRHSEKMRIASLKWEEEKAQLLNEIQRIQAKSPQPLPASAAAVKPRRGRRSGSHAHESSTAQRYAGAKSRTRPLMLPKGDKQSRSYAWSSSSPTSVCSESSSDDVSDDVSAVDDSDDIVERKRHQHHHQQQQQQQQQQEEEEQQQQHRHEVAVGVTSPVVAEPKRMPQDRSRSRSGSSSWNGLKNRSNTVEVELILDSFDSDSSVVPSGDQLKRLSSANRRQSQKFMTTLRGLAGDSTSHTQDDLLSVQRSHQRQLSRMAEVHLQLQRKLSEKKYGWEKISTQQVDQLARDRDNLMMQLNNLQEIIETQRVKLEDISGRRDSVLQFSAFQVLVDIPTTWRRGRGAQLCIYYQVMISIGAVQWCVDRSYLSFRSFHENVLRTEGLSDAVVLLFPPFKWFNAKGMAFVENRREQLKAYVSAVMASLSANTKHLWHIAESENDLKDMICQQFPFLDPGVH